ncbi:MAG TPA: sugar phosphate isomerase/epimerase [Bacteroidales bacterium]|nr:sugar phosphate isomerase/epimerase [Bacteroidales bacterium]
MENNLSKKQLSRRKFVGGTAALAAVSMVPFGLSSCGEQKPAAAPAVPAKPTSNYCGVQLGTITYSWRSMPGGVENVIRYCKDSGLTSIELMSNDVEEYLGAPKNPMMVYFTAPKPGPQKTTQGPPPPPPPKPGAQKQPAPPQFRLTPEQEAAIKKYNEDMKAWRLALPLSKFEDIKKMFDNEGIGIHIVKFSPAHWSDEEIDYAFKAAKALGAKGVTDEIGEEAVKKLGPIAEKHGMYAIFHNHMQFATQGFSYDPFMAVSPAVMFNFDAGHFFGSTGLHPNTIIEKYHERIFSIHLKDKTGPKTDPANTNQVWGQGEMPISDVLQLIQKNKWPIYCDIELEYDIKPWSNAVKETKICNQFARQILI